MNNVTPGNKPRGSALSWYPHHALIFSPARERGRRFIVRLTVVYLFLLLTEGIMRKWLLPQYSEVIFFIRDPVVLTIYIWALRYGFWPRINIVLAIGGVLAVMGTGVAFIQAFGITDSRALILNAYGWRNYFFYLPLPFILGKVLSPSDVNKLFRIIVVFSLPIAALAIIQFYSPVYSLINTSIGAGVEGGFQAFSGAGGRIRPNTLFTASLGQSLYVASLWAILLALWLTRADARPVGRPLLLAASAAVAAMVAVSIARGLVVHVGIIFAGALIATVLIRGVKSKLAAWILVPSFLVMVTGSMLMLMPEAFDAFGQRFSNAAASEGGAQGFLRRIMGSFTLFSDRLAETPLLGFGLGSGSNAARILPSLSLPYFPEDDWSAHIADFGTILGPFFILFRILFVIWLTSFAINSTRRCNNPYPLILLGFVGVLLLNGQIVGHGTVHGFVWLVVGILLASGRCPRSAKPADGWTTMRTRVNAPAYSISGHSNCGRGVRQRRSEC